MGDYARTWDFAVDGVLDGRLLTLTQVQTGNGPAPKGTFELDDGEQVDVWLSATVLKNRLVEELNAREADEFEPNERIRIARGAKGISSAGNEFWNFDVSFEHGAGPMTARSVLTGSRSSSNAAPAASPVPQSNGYQATAADDDIPFAWFDAYSVEPGQSIRWHHQINP